MKKLPQGLLLMSAILLASTTQAEPATTSAPAPTAAVPTGQSQAYGYIGIGIDKVPDSLKAQYPDGVATTQGLVVTRFADESPAADDGIKVYDILIAYDDQPIEDPAKFIAKVRKDTPNRIAQFKLIRQGKVITVPVTIGSQKAAPKPVPAVPAITQMPKQMPQYVGKNQPMINMPAGMTVNTPPPANFNGLAIRKVAEGVYEASIGFIGADGKPQHRAYRGSHIQILQQVRAANDLSPQARQQLLFALRPPKSKTQAQGWGGMPFGNGHMPSPKSFFKGWGW